MRVLRRLNHARGFNVAIAELIARTDENRGSHSGSSSSRIAYPSDYDNYSNEKLLFFLSLPATAVFEVLTASSDKPSLATPPPVSRFAQHFGVGSLFGFLVAVLPCLLRRVFPSPEPESLPAAKSAPEPHLWLRKSLLRTDLFATLYILHLSLTSLMGEKVGLEMLMYKSSGQAPNKTISDTFLKVLCSYPIDAWYSIKKILRLPPNYGDYSSDWTLAGFISPMCFLLILECVRLHLTRRSPQEYPSPLKSSRDRAVNIGASISSLLFVFQLWVSFS
jgi:hypothetical protein